MTISAVQETGVTSDSVTSSDKTFTSSVTAGNLLVVMAHKDNSTAFVAGDCSMASGTCTVGAWSLDKNLSFDMGSSPSSVGIWSTIITGTGTCMIRVKSAASAFWVRGQGEYSTTVGWDSSRLETSNTSSSATDNVTTMTSGSVTSAGGALFAAVAGSNASGARTIGPDASFTQIYEEENGSSHLIGSTQRRIVTSGTTDAADWTIGTSNVGYLAAIAVYKEAAGGGGGGTAAKLLIPTDLMTDMAGVAGGFQ